MSTPNYVFVPVSTLPYAIPGPSMPEIRVAGLSEPWIVTCAADVDLLPRIPEDVREAIKLEFMRAAHPSPIKLIPGVQNMPKQENPRECPFCGRDDLSIPIEKNQDFFYVSCENPSCGAMGPNADSFEEAVLAWNGLGSCHTS